MKTHRSTGPLIVLLASLAVAACKEPAGGNGGNDGNGGSGGSGGAGQDMAAAPPSQAAKPSAARAASPGKPSAPLTIDYEVVGTPIVGQPLNIDLRITTAEDGQAVTVNYGVVDTSALTFAQAQTERVSLGRVNRRQPARQQVTVVPQREGRLYLNVSAEIETPNGVLLKSIAIPIQVGSAPAEREVNGELTEDAAGEAIESMPASDKPPSQ